MLDKLNWFLLTFGLPYNDASFFLCMFKIEMRTTLNIDDDLYAQAAGLTGVHEKTALLREGLLALVKRESARRLALLGGSEPELTSIPRRQSRKLIK